MKLGRFTVTPIVFGSFRLDGGCMFGSVPKNLWSRTIGADDENCIPLVCRSLVIEDGPRTFLVDVGMGEKWGEKPRQLYGIKSNSELARGYKPELITDVILTHLHFDHAGGISYRDAAGDLQLTYPNAQVHLQSANWAQAQNPSPKDKASYLMENIEPLKKARLVLYDGTTEIVPGLFLHRVDGHTAGQQWLEVVGEGERIFFPTDLIPTSHHLPLAYHMGYDVCAETLLREKLAFLERAHKEDAIVAFQHDSEVVAARVGVNERGQFCVRERVNL